MARPTFPLSEARSSVSITSRPPYRDIVMVLAASGTLAACHVGQPLASPASRSADSVEVGYGRQASRDVTGSVATVDGDVAQRTSPTSVADILAGRFAGVEVTRLASGGTSVRIRGQRSFRGGGEPLYVVNGIPQHGVSNGVLDDIAPRDIQSVEVLKDAGATAAYGARGANGVILITTIRPR